MSHCEDLEIAVETAAVATLAALLEPLGLDDALGVDDLLAIAGQVGEGTGCDAGPEASAALEQVLGGMATRARLYGRIRSLAASSGADPRPVAQAERLLLHGATPQRLASLAGAPGAALQVSPADLKQCRVRIESIEQRWAQAWLAYPVEAKLTEEDRSGSMSYRASCASAALSARASMTTHRAVSTAVAALACWPGMSQRHGPSSCRCSARLGSR